jgi:hypothetical protein
VVVAEQPIYFFLPSLLTVVGVLESLRMPELAPQSELPPVTGPRRGVLRRGAALAALLAAALAYAMSAAATVASIFEFGAVAGTGAPLPAYVSNALASAAEVRARGEPFSIVSRNVPDGLVPPSFSPFNRLSRVLDVNDPAVPVNGFDENWYAPDATGELLPVEASWRRSVSVDPAGHSVALDVAGMEPVPTGNDAGACFRVVSTESHLVVPLGEPVSGNGLVVRTQATVDQATPIRTIVGSPGRGFTPANADLERWRTDSPGRIDPVSDTVIDSVGYDGLAPGVNFCLRTVWVGDMPLPN